MLVKAVKVAKAEKRRLAVLLLQNISYKLLNRNNLFTISETFHYFSVER